GDDALAVVRAFPEERLPPRLGEPAIARTSVANRDQGQRGRFSVVHGRGRDALLLLYEKPPGRGSGATPPPDRWEFLAFFLPRIKLSSLDKRFPEFQLLAHSP